jgi:hypothetical protein
MGRVVEGLVYLLLKFATEKQHLEEFRDGLLFMRPLAYFARLEETCAGRGDRFEGTSAIIQPKDSKVIIDTGNRGIGKIIARPEDLAGPVRIVRSSTRSCDAYCMVAVRRVVDGGLVPIAVTKFGDWFVIVTNVSDFLSRVDGVMEAENSGITRLERRLVEYCDTKEYSGEMGRFRKRTEYQHQSEFRIVVEPVSAEYRNFFVGSLRDITSEVLPSSAAWQGWVVS